MKVFAGSNPLPDVGVRIGFGRLASYDGTRVRCAAARECAMTGHKRRWPVPLGFHQSQDTTADWGGSLEVFCYQWKKDGSTRHWGKLNWPPINADQRR